MEVATKKKILFGATGLVVVVAAYGIYWYLTKNQETTRDSFAGSFWKKTYKATVFPLSKGSKGEEVKKLQKALNQKLRPPSISLTVDGIFGSNTLRVLKQQTGKESVSKGEYSNLIASVFPF